MLEKSIDELLLLAYKFLALFQPVGLTLDANDGAVITDPDFLRRLVKRYARRDIRVECVQTDNGFEFTNRFFNSKRNLQTLFENTAADLGIRHKLIRPYTPRHNGKVERSHREDQKRFYSCHSSEKFSEWLGNS